MASSCDNEGLGLLSGLGEWDLAGRLSTSMFDDGILNPSEMERAVAEIGLVKGWPACAHLGSTLGSIGIRVPANVVGAVAAIRASQPAAPGGNAAGISRLSEREIFKDDKSGPARHRARPDLGPPTHLPRLSGY